MFAGREEPDMLHFIFVVILHAHQWMLSVFVLQMSFVVEPNFF